MLRPGGTPSLPMALRLQGPATNVSPNITGHITRNTTRNTTAPDRGHDRKLRSGLIRKFGSRRSVSIAPRRRSRSEGGAGRGTDWSRRGMPIGERRRVSGAPPPRAGYPHAHMYGNGARADVRRGARMARMTHTGSGACVAAIETVLICVGDVGHVRYRTYSSTITRESRVLARSSAVLSGELPKNR